MFVLSTGRETWGGEVKEGEGGKEEQGGHREGEEKRGLI